MPLNGFLDELFSSLKMQEIGVGSPPFTASAASNTGMSSFVLQPPIHEITRSEKGFSETETLNVS